MTVAGFHTVTEVNDLIRAKNTEIGVIQSDYDRLNNAAWKSSPEGQKWLSDWRTFQAKWAAAVTSAQPSLVAAKAMVFIPDNAIPAEEVYTTLVGAAEGIATVPGLTWANLTAMLGPVGTVVDILHPAQKQEGYTHPGGIQDLFSRLSAVSPTLMAEDAAIGKKIQPTAHSDVDLETFKVLDKAKHEIEKAPEEIPWKRILFGVGLAFGGYAYLSLRKPAVVIKQERPMPPLESL